MVVSRGCCVRRGRSCWASRLPRSSVRWRRTGSSGRRAVGEALHKGARGFALCPPRAAELRGGVCGTRRRREVKPGRWGRRGGRGGGRQPLGRRGREGLNGPNLWLFCPPGFPDFLCEGSACPAPGGRRVSGWCVCARVVYMCKRPARCRPPSSRASHRSSCRIPDYCRVVTALSTGGAHLGLPWSTVDLKQDTFFLAVYRGAPPLMDRHLLPSSSRRRNLLKVLELENPLYQDTSSSRLQVGGWLVIFSEWLPFYILS